MRVPYGLFLNVAVQVTFAIASLRKCYRCGPESKNSYSSSLSSVPSLQQVVVDDNPLEPCEEGFVTNPDDYVVECDVEFEGCMKGWIESEEGLSVTRGCALVGENMCLLQGRGGSCSCYGDRCNGGTMTTALGALSVYYGCLISLLIL